VDLDLAPQDDPRRLAVRSWLDGHPNPTGRQLAEAGYVVPHWPAPYGLGADPLHQLIVDEELRRAEVTLPSNPIGIGWAAPTILLAGTAVQKERYLWPALAGEEQWCQLFSEPDAGSDLASLTTRATRDGDTWVVDGTKIWTSGAHVAKFGILLARTDPDAPKHRGISYFICPMSSPGITVTPILDMTGSHTFNQVFLDGVRLGAEHLVGAEGDGWPLAKATLANERVSLSSGGALWGSGPSAQDLIDLVRRDGGIREPLRRLALAQVWAEGEVLRLIRLRTLSARLAGATPGPEASVQKLLGDRHGQQVMAVARQLAGTSGLLEGAGPEGALPPQASRMSAAGGRARSTPTATVPGVDPIWHHGFLFSPALTIGGGTWAVQRNIVAESVLGLPRDPGT
jgi:alkylation response protein AidB-like acyl-CoA dehydrogenase